MKRQHDPLKRHKNTVLRRLGAQRRSQGQGQDQGVLGQNTGMVEQGPTQECRLYLGRAGPAPEAVLVPGVEPELGAGVGSEAGPVPGPDSEKVECYPGMRAGLPIGFAEVVGPDGPEEVQFPLTARALH